MNVDAGAARELSAAGKAAWRRIAAAMGAEAMELLELDAKPEAGRLAAFAQSLIDEIEPKTHAVADAAEADTVRRDRPSKRGRGVDSSLTVDEAAAALRVHPETIRRLIRRGDLEARKIGSVWRIPASAVSTFTPPERAEPRPRAARPDRVMSALVRARLATQKGVSSV